MKAAWQHFPGVFPSITCNEIISHCLGSYAPKKATVGLGATPREDSKIRTTKVRWLDVLDPELASIVQIIRYKGLMANANAFGMDLSPELHEFQFLEYNDFNQGHYDWHIDLSWFPNQDKQSPFQRKLSCVIQLSDPSTYEGGRLELKAPQGHELKNDVFRNPGDMIFFPSFLEHKANAVMKGTRYCLTVWFNGPNFR